MREVGLVVLREIGLVDVHGPYAASVTSATSCWPLAKLNTRMSPTVNVCWDAQVV